MFAAQFVLCEGSEDEILAETIEKYQEENVWQNGEANEQFLLRGCRTVIVNIIPRRDIGQIQILWINLLDNVDKYLIWQYLSGSSASGP